MDTITHSLLGAVVVRALSPAPSARHSLTRAQLLATGAIAGAFPDSDYIGSFIDPMVYLTLWHRSITHSLVLLPLWSLVLGFVLAALFRKRAEWRWFAAFAGAAVLSHILSDLITVYGTQILAPLSGWRASIGTTFIIDPWFTLIVLAGFVAAARTRTATAPRIGLVVLATYVGMQGLLKHQAADLARQYVARQGLSATRIISLPQPLSPFNWKLIVDTGNDYWSAYTSLSGGYRFCADAHGFWGKVCGTYRPPGHLDWRHTTRFGDTPAVQALSRRLWGDPQLRYFRRFAEVPALYRIDSTVAHTCVWFTDLRYRLPYMTPPFRYGLCREAAKGAWRLERLRRSSGGKP